MLLLRFHSSQTSFWGKKISISSTQPISDFSFHCHKH
jgi:hypothetical protein